MSKRTKWIRTLGLALVAIALPGGCANDTAPRPVVVVAQPPQLDQLTAAVRSGSFGRIEAVLVKAGGEDVYEAYFGSTTAQTRVDVRSAGKSITALAVGTAIDDGALPGTDLLVWDYLTGSAPVPEDGPAKRAITVADLLSMSSALDCNDWDSSSPGNEERMYDADDWTGFALAIPIDQAYTRLPNGQGRFSYCTAGAFLLGQVVEKAVGMPFDAYVQQRLFDPLGIAGADWRRSPIGEVQSGGQLGITATDLARIGQMVNDAGVVDGQQVVSRDWLRAMLTPKVGVTANEDYAYLWWTRNFTPAGGDPTPGAFMLGNGGNMLLLVPAYDAVIVVQSTSYNVEEAFGRSVALVETYILPALANSNSGV